MHDGRLTFAVVRGRAAVVRRCCPDNSLSEAVRRPEGRCCEGGCRAEATGAGSGRRTAFGYAASTSSQVASTPRVSQPPERVVADGREGDRRGGAASPSPLHRRDTAVARPSRGNTCATTSSSTFMWRSRSGDASTPTLTSVTRSGLTSFVTVAGSVHGPPFASRLARRTRAGRVRGGGHERASDPR